MQNRFHIPLGRYSPNHNSRFRFSLKRINNKYTDLILENLTNENNHGTYSELLFDERWKLKRKEILIRDQSKCTICQDKTKLQVHHRQYHFIKELGQFKTPWDYENHLLITLCENCHKRGHSKFKVPTIYI